MIRARILSFVAWFIVSAWTRSLNIRSLNGEERDRLRAEGKSFIYAFWHGNMFLLLGASRNSNVLIPVSESADGDIMAGMLRLFGCEVVRGSSSRNGHKALFGMVCGVRKGETIGVAVDGPKGPLHEVKKGAAFVAGKMNIPIIPVACAADRSWVLESTWEKLMLPVPFARGVILFGGPIFVSNASEEALETGRQKLEQALQHLDRQAQDLMAGGNKGQEPLYEKCQS